jgi:hypothetical protein
MARISISMRVRIELGYGVGVRVGLRVRESIRAILKVTIRESETG